MHLSTAHSWYNSRVVIGEETHVASMNSSVAYMAALGDSVELSTIVQSRLMLRMDGPALTLHTWPAAVSVVGARTHDRAHVNEQHKGSDTHIHTHTYTHTVCQDAPIHARATACTRALSTLKPFNRRMAIGVPCCRVGRKEANGSRQVFPRHKRIGRGVGQIDR